MEGGCAEGGPHPHLLLCKELRAPQCMVRLSAILLTLSGSQSVPPTPVSSVPGPCPSWAGQGGGESARTRAGGQLGQAPSAQRFSPSLSHPQGRLPTQRSQDYLANILFVVALAGSGA